MNTPNIARIERQVRASGIKQSVPDDRDYVFARRVPGGPVDVSQYFSRVEDQGTEGDCTAMTANLAEETILRYGGINLPGNGQLSPRFQYLMTRRLDGHTGDVGGSPRNMCKAADKYGACLDETWPLSRGIDEDPPAAVFDEALARSGMYYEYIPVMTRDPEDVYQDMISAQKAGGLIAAAFWCRRWMFGINRPLGSQGHCAPAMPGGNTGLNEVVGGHIMLSSGNNDTMYPDQGGGAMIFQNSWTPAWGDNGRCSFSKNQMKAPNFLMEVRVIWSFAGISMGLPPTTMLTVAQVNAARAKLAALGLGVVDAATGAFNFNASVDLPALAAVRALAGMDAAQKSQVVGFTAAGIETFEAGHIAQLAAWKAI